MMLPRVVACLVLCGCLAASAADRPRVLPTVRAFVNFGGDAAWMQDKIDLAFRLEPKQSRADMLAVRYALVCTMLEPSEKATALREWCRREGYDYEDCFIHFGADTEVTLHAGAEGAANPKETRVCPGWDVRNDADLDGVVSDAEFAVRANRSAGARRRLEARVPIYYWGPPTDDFVMNVGCLGYQRFIAECHAPEVVAGWDGIFFDTVPDDVAGPGRRATVAEYPRQGAEADRWSRDVQRLFALVRARLPQKLLLANGWVADPLVVDGFQLENWLHCGTPCHEWRRRIDLARQHDRAKHVQLLQYNPVHDPELVQFGVNVPGVNRERDQLYGLASYLMAHGDNSYFGFGLHPYGRVTELWFDAMRVDLGEPRGECHPWGHDERPRSSAGTNLLRNGSLDSLAEWRTAPGIVVDPAVKHEGLASARVESVDPQAIRIHSQNVVLAPRTTYTLSAWVKTQAVRGGIGAQVYPYDFVDAVTAPVAMLNAVGTTDWTLHEMTFTTADDAEGRISLRISESLGIAWFDDVRLIEGGRPPGPSVFVREFAKGIVLVRPPDGTDFTDPTEMRIPLPRRMKPLRADGHLEAETSSISLRNGEAAILLTP